VSPVKKLCPPQCHPRGLSLVELLIGIAIGLFIVAGAVLLTTTQLSDNRRLMLETQLQQDLRATADIVTRELRRAGAWDNADTGVADPVSGAANHNAFSTVSTTTGVTFSYQRSVGAQGPFGFKLEGGVIKTLLAVGGWQDLTDANTVVITAFSLTPQDREILPPLTCPKTCPAPVGPVPAGKTSENYCWPTLTVREFALSITGQAANDSSVTRTIRSTVRLRNDQVQFNADPVNPDQACPS
jgi:type II secretory pathway component PulJ